ncbi:Aminotransferase class IV [Macrophomina phaseolina MS6]|uniref:Aminotransferase class IV n=1 Tax=Macrophomina phaseolina (strain MS6) TaxID=1126212 RepID=K2SH13_MACPH|nr:Aminotransferase class IV [Macrophomina phaseolina MS6]
MSMPEIPTELFLQCVNLAVTGNAEYVCPHDFNGSLYVRPVLFASSVQLAVVPPDEFTFCVYVQHHLGLHGPGDSKALVLDEFDRAATRGVGAAKAGGNYAPVIRWTLKAKQMGFDFLLHLDSKTQSEVEEFSWSAFVGVRRSSEEDATIVLSDSSAIVQSITADCVSELAKSFGWKVERRPVSAFVRFRCAEFANASPSLSRQVDFDELKNFAEVLAVGTAAGITPVSSIHRPSTGTIFRFDPEGFCYRKLWSALLGIQRGTEADRFGWCSRVCAV